MAVTGGHAPVSFPRCAHPCPAYDPRSACGAAARHLIARTPVGGIRCLFLSQQLGVFLLQAFDGGQLFHAQLVKGILRRLVQQNVALMLRKILFGVTGLAVARVNVAGLGVVDDVRFQHGDLRHARLRRPFRLAASPRCR